MYDQNSTASNGMQPDCNLAAPASPPSGVSEATPPAGSDVHRLDPEKNKSPSEQSKGVELLAVPMKSGGRMDDRYGRGKRIEDLKRFKVLEQCMRCPALATLTLDRKRFSGPKEAYEYASPKVSKLLTERLGLTTWARVSEVQSKTGDGWMHFHVVVDLAEFNGTIGQFNKRLWSVWRDAFGIGGCDVQRIRKSVAGYVANYVNKKWSAIPRWMGESRKRFRIVGFSKEANRRIRRKLQLPEPVSCPRSMRRRRNRTTRSLFDRLATSGLRLGLVARRNDDGYTHYVGQMANPLEVLRVCGSSMRSQIRTALAFVGCSLVEGDPAGSPGGRADPWIRFPELPSVEHAESLARSLESVMERAGVASSMEAIRRSRRAALEASWANRAAMA